MNVNFDDTGLVVDYVNDFLKDKYSSDIILSNHYDYNTHNNLIDFLNICDTVPYNVLIDKIMEYPYFDFNRYFKSYYDLDSVTLKSKTHNQDNINYVNKFFNDVDTNSTGSNNKNRSDFITYVSNLGWKIKEWNISDTYPQSIVLVPLNTDIRFDRDDVIKMVNIFNEHYIYGIGFYPDSADIELSGFSDYKTLCLKCKANKKFTIICNESGLSGNNILVASSNKYYDKINNYDGFQTIYNIVESEDNVLEYSTENNEIEINTILILLPKNYNNKVLVIESPMEELLDSLNISEFTEEFLDNFYFDKPWLLHERFIQSILYNAINKYSSEYDIKYVQDSIHNIYSGLYEIDISKGHTYGIFDNDLKSLVIRLQKENNLIYSNGTVYPDLESIFDKINASKGM